MPQTVAIIPARHGSTRLPGKPLLAETGRPLVVHVADRAAAAHSVDRVLIATDEPRIRQAAERHGYEAALTRSDHPNGTSRVAEAAEALGAGVSIVVNVQGDEPHMDPGLIDRLVDRLSRGDEPMATIASPFAAGEDPAEANIVKVVADRAGRAMYFSRALIPHDRDGAGASRPLKHAGIYAYRRDFLPTYAALPPTPAERAEKLEQLRALEHGYAIAVVEANVEHHGIDTRAQYEAFVAERARLSEPG